MNKQNLLIIIIIVLIVALGIALWQNSKTADAPEQVSNNTQNTDSAPTEDQDQEPNTPEQELPAADDAASFENDLANKGKSWTLWQVTLDKKVVNMDAKISAPLTLQFDTDKNSYTGFAGCNNFSGTYSTSGTMGFDFGATVSTKKACADPKPQSLENSIFQAMEKVSTTGIKGNQLVFTSADGYTELVYNQAI